VRIPGPGVVDAGEHRFEGTFRTVGIRVLGRRIRLLATLTIGFLNDNGGNTFPAWYDALGRYYNLGISFKF